jgi:NTE family protein
MPKFAHILCALCYVLPFVLNAQPIADGEHSHVDTTMSRPTVAVVLGGGGARGAAHIGVLQVLEEHRIPVDLVTGTSMGALVGGLYAAGHRPADMQHLLADIDWKHMFKDSPPRETRHMRRKREDIANLGTAELGVRDGKIVIPRGALQGHRLLLWLRRQTLGVRDVENFAELPIPFACVATDIVSTEKAVLTQGDLAMSMRASMAVPGVFSPIRVNGQLMVDGGVVDNVPISVARDLGADRLIVVDVGAPLLTEEQLGSPMAISLQMVSALMKRETDRSLATLGSNDILIRPALGEFSSADFDGSASTVAVGRQAALDALPQLLPLALNETDWQAHLAARGMPDHAALQINRVVVDDSRTRSSRHIARTVSRIEPGALSIDQLEDVLDQTMSEGGYERVNYHLRRVGDESILSIEPVDKGWGPGYLRFGFALGDDFAGGSAYQATGDLRLTGLDERGREWRNRVQLGQRSGVLTELYQPIGDDGRFYALGSADYEVTEQPFEVLDQSIALFSSQVSRGGAEIGFYPNDHWQLSTGLQFGRHHLDRLIGSSDIAEHNSFSSGAWTFGATYDTLDDVGFPTRGSRFDAALRAFRPGLGSDEEADVVRLRFDRPIDTRLGTLLIGAQADWALTGRDSGEAITTLGGFGRLTGLRENERVGTRSVLARVLGYRGLNETRLASVPLYAGFSLEAGQNWLSFESAQVGDLDYSASVFFAVRSPLGPLYLGYGRSTSGDSSAFLRIGTLIDDLRR